MLTFVRGAPSALIVQTEHTWTFRAILLSRVTLWCHATPYTHTWLVHLQLRQAPAQTATVVTQNSRLVIGIPHAMLSSAGSAKRSVNASVCSAKRARTKRPHPTLQQHALPSPRVMPNSNSWGIPERMPATAQLAHTDQPRARAPPAAMLPNALISCAAPANTLVQMHAPRVQTGNTRRSKAM